MRLDRRGFLAGLPLLGFMAPLLSRWARRLVLSVESLPQDYTIEAHIAKCGARMRPWLVGLDPVFCGSPAGHQGAHVRHRRGWTFEWDEEQVRATMPLQVWDA